MPVTVKIQDKTPKGEPVAPAPDLSDYAEPNERGEGAKAFWLWFIPMLLISVGPMATEATRGVGIGIFAWWVLSSIAYFIIGPRMVLRRLRLHGDEYAITARKHPRLHSLLAKGSSMLDIAPPEGFLVDEGFSQIRVINAGLNVVIVTKAASEMLQPNELEALVLRSLVQIRQKQVRRFTLIQLLADTPAAMRPLAWPVAIYANLLRAFWSDYADQTADRLTLIMIRNDKLLMSALLKQFAVSDPLMRENSITTEDVDNFIKQAGIIDTSGASISTQYKIGSSIQANPYLEERVNALRAWAKSQQFRDAVEKMAAARAKTAGGEAA